MILRKYIKEEEEERNEGNEKIIKMNQKRATSVCR
jgi:hypothetical protein